MGGNGYFPMYIRKRGGPFFNNGYDKTDTNKLIKGIRGISSKHKQAIRKEYLLISYRQRFQKKTLLNFVPSLSLYKRVKIEVEEFGEHP